MIEQEVTERTEQGRSRRGSPTRGWFEVSDVATIASPALLVYRERVEENLRRMVKMAGGADRLRPHIKTHKMREMISLQLALGITKFKCATVAEAEMAASAGVTDLLVGYQLAGPNVERFAQLVRAFPKTKFSTICDDGRAIKELARALEPLTTPLSLSDGERERSTHGGIEVLLDIDVGQHRTGVPAGPKAVELYRLIGASPGLKPGGLHAYDGHISDSDLTTRTAVCDAAFAPVMALRRELLDAGMPVPRIVAGGTPTFPIHARRPKVECSPGTCVFWDASYSSRLHDMDFLPAALVLTRVISKPGPNLLCLDLGHKALASEMPHPRVQFLELPDAQAVVHSEEHLVVETAQASEFSIGDCLYGIPRHICPTVALHSAAVLIENGKTAGLWKVAARDRRLTI